MTGAPNRRPRLVLCRTCNDTGVVQKAREACGGSRAVVTTDACPDCAKRAEDTWRWMREQ